MKHGIYKHYKGPLYRVTDTGKHSETEQEFVIYHAIEKPNQTWLRPKDMFVENVVIEGITRPRFEFISEQTNL